MIANIYYELFSKLIKKFFYFKNSKILIVESFFSIKTLLFLAKNFYGYFFRFDKYHIFLI